MIKKRNAPSLNDILRARRSRQIPENLIDKKEIDWVKNKVDKMNFYCQLYFKDEDEKRLEKIYNPSIEHKLESTNCAYEKTIEFNHNPKHQWIRYIFKDYFT